MTVLKPGSVAIAIGLTISGSGSVMAAPPPLPQQVNEVVQYLTRPLETTIPGRTGPDAPKVRMMTCRIQVNTSAAEDPQTSVFLYQEQALTTQLNQPYRQRVLQLEADPTQQQVISRNFKPKLQDLWVGMCQRSSQARRIPQAVLGPELCQLRLQRQPQGDRYVGQTPPEGCPTSFRGATRITNTVILGPTGMETWDRGFDAEGRQLWGAKDESYQFRPVGP